MENKAYDGILPMLEELKGKGARLLVATSKPHLLCQGDPGELRYALLL